MHARLVLPDWDEAHLVELSNGTLHHRADDPDATVDATIRLPRARFEQLLAAPDPTTVLAADDVEIDGDAVTFRAALDRIDHFAFWFNIVTP